MVMPPIYMSIISQCCLMMRHMIIAARFEKQILSTFENK